MSIPSTPSSRRLWGALAAVLAGAIALPAAGVGIGAAAAPKASSLVLRHANAPQIVPKPVHMTSGKGRFKLTPKTRIAFSGGPAA